MNPEQEAIAFRIWQHCEVHGWDFYASQLAERLDLPLGKVRRAIQSKGWNGRLPTVNRGGALDAKEAAIHRVPREETTQELRFE